MTKSQRNELKHFIEHLMPGLKPDQAIKRLARHGVKSPDLFYRHWRLMYTTSIINIIEDPQTERVNIKRRVRMPKKTEAKVIDLYLKGYRRDQIAQLVGYSASTITDKIKIYNSKRLEG